MTTSETTTMRAKTQVILERFPYRFVQKGLLEINGEPDYRIQKFNEVTRLYSCLLYTSDAADE